MMFRSIASVLPILLIFFDIFRISAQLELRMDKGVLLAKFVLNFVRQRHEIMS